MKKELSIGMSVHASDGKVGSLERIVVDPKTHEPAYLVVRHGPPPPPRSIVVPVSLVSEVSTENVMLNTTQQAFKAFPNYELTIEKPVEKPLETPKKPSYTDRWPNILPFPTVWTELGTVKVRERTVPEHMVEVKRGMTVYDSTGNRLGEVDGLIANSEQQQVTHLVLNTGTPLKEERRLVPIDLVDFSIRSDVYLRIGKEYVQGLPFYQAD